MSEDEQEEVDVDLFEEALNEKIELYFSSNNNELLTYEKLDDFLKSVELYEMWNSEEEKDVLWQCLMKYNINNKIDKNGAIKGMHDLLTQEEENQKDNKEDNLLTRISRVAYKNDTGPVNKLVLNKYKQKALDEYDCLDNPTLIQFKKIFVLLNINPNNKNIITPEKIDEICSKHKFIKIERNEIIKYLSFLTCEDKPIEEIKTININIDIYNEIDSLFQEKLLDEDMDQSEENEEEEENEEKKEDPMDILEDILQKIEITNDNIIVLKDMRNNLLKLNENMGENIKNMAQDNENNDENQENVSNIESLQIMINEKMEKFDDFLQNMNKEQKSYIKKIHNLKKSIINFNNDMTTLKEDYKILYEKYNNNQELEVDDEMERLLDENVALNQEINLKKEEISDLLNERTEKDKQINELYIKLDNNQIIEKELRKQIAELTIDINKQKNDYENLMDTVVNKIEKKENEEKREREKIKEMIEKQLKSEEDKKNENNKNKNDKDEQFKINELNDIDNMNIPLTDKLLKKKKILSQLSNEQLMEYTLKLERLNISLKSEKNKKDQQIKEKNETIESLNKAILSKKKDIGVLSSELNKLKKLNANLQNEVKTNEIFRPSIAMSGNMRISRMSKLNTVGLNVMKFGGGFNKNENKITNSSDYFKNDKNMNFSIKNKKNIKTTKLKDKNINLQIGKEQKTKFTPQNILNSIYGDGDKINEEINEEDNEKNEEEKNDEKEKKNNNNLEVSNNIESTIKGQKMPFTNLEQNGIEFDIQKKVNDIGQNEMITIDNINDINLGGNMNDMIEIKNEGEINIENDKNDKNSNLQKTTESFFESKPLENNFEIFDKKANLDKIHSMKNDNYKEVQNKTYGGIFSNNEKKEENPSNDLYDDDNDRDTIQVNANQNIAGGLEDMIFNELENNEDDIKMNTGRESDNHAGLKKIFQMSKYDMGIKNENKNEDKGDIHSDRLKSSDNCIVSFNPKDKLNHLEENNSNNIIIEGNKNNNNEDKKEEKKDNKILEINNNNQINIDNKNQNKILEINNNNQIDIENKKENEIKKFGIENNSINIENNNPVNRKRTIVDVGPNKLSSEKVLGITNAGSEEIQGRNRIKTIQPANNSSYSAIGKKNGFISLEEQEKIENNNYDYCSLFHEDYVKKKLSQLNDNGNEKNIYSDEIYLLSDKKKSLEKRLMLLTPSYLYIIESKEAQFVLTLNKNEINKIAISNQNLNILAFIKNNGVNILLLTLRRMDLLYYLRDYYRKSNQIPLRFTYQDEYKVMIKGKYSTLSVKDKIFTTLSNFDGAIKIGYLQKLNPHFKHFKLFNQRLVVLSSIGLIVFDDPTKPPERLYPIINSEIKQVSAQKYKKSNCFEIKTLAGETKVFAAYKEREMTSWIEEFNKVKEDFKKKMKKLDTANKIEFIDNNNALPNVEEEKVEDELLPNSKKDI